MPPTSSHDAPTPVQPAEFRALVLAIERITPRLAELDPLRAHLILAWHECLTITALDAREPRF